jgi:hypothetical protein
VVFQSGQGHTEVLAGTVFKGVNGVGRLSGQVFEIRRHAVDARALCESCMDGSARFPEETTRSTPDCV